MSDKIYTLIPLDEFKAILCLDDRDDKTARFCLTTATLEIENYCHRHFLLKRHFEDIEFLNDLYIPLREYPIKEIISVFTVNSEQGTGNSGTLIEPEFYRLIPSCSNENDLPCAIELSPSIGRMRGLKIIKVKYWAGYKLEKIPADLSAACMELAVWNFNRYKGRRVGFTGSVKKDGERFEMVMPENVRMLLEPYRRKTI